MKNNIVRKHNDVIEACFNMSVPELRLIYSCISQIEFGNIIEKEQPFFITATDYAKVFNVDNTNVYREIKNAVNKIWGRDLVIQREGKTPLTCRWVSAKAEFGDGGAEIHFSTEVIPYLINLQKNGNFTKYRLENIGGLKSSYSIRLYELLIQYKSIGKRRIELADLRSILCISGKYKAMKDLKKWVLDLAVTEINKETDIRINYKTIKRGRSVAAFDFLINKKVELPDFSAPKSPISNNGEQTGKIWLTDAEVDARSRPGEIYPKLYERLKAEGYSFNKKFGK